MRGENGANFPKMLHIFHQFLSRPNNLYSDQVNMNPTYFIKNNPGLLNKKEEAIFVLIKCVTTTLPMK